jgi:hypothetical protein
MIQAEFLYGPTPMPKGFQQRQNDDVKQCVKCILRRDATGLRKAVASSWLLIDNIEKLTFQAARVDEKHGLLGRQTRHGSLLHGLMTGFRQCLEDLKSVGREKSYEKAVTLFCGLASEQDSVAILQGLFALEPSFLMGRGEDPPTIDSTVGFFLDTNASKCAAWISENLAKLRVHALSKNRLCFTIQHSLDVIVQNARDLISKTEYPFIKEVLEDVVTDRFPVVLSEPKDDDTCYFHTFGLLLIGRPEIVIESSKDELVSVTDELNNLVRTAMAIKDRSYLLETYEPLDVFEFASTLCVVELHRLTRHLRKHNSPRMLVQVE